MEFRVLGPLEVVADGRRLHLGGTRQHRLLAALLLAANRTVDLSYLIRAGWDDASPTTARRQVQNRISTLRATLTRAGGGDLLRTEHTGYLLRVAPERFDLLRFEALLASARRPAADGEAAAAVRDLHAALGLWRGPALAGLDAPALEPEARRLEERRLAAFEERVELEYALGTDHRLVDELTTAVDEHPLRERLVGQLMRALYRGGRQAEALAAFRQLRERLVDELGIEPAAELRQLHGRILRGDRELLRRPAATSAPPPRQAAPVPRHLPAPASVFLGRDEPLRALDRALAGHPPDDHGTRLVVVAGAAGVGKTALALHWARAAMPAFPDGQLYVDLHGFSPNPPLPATEALGAILRGLDVAPDAIPATEDERAALYRSLVAGRRLLVVLDNARDADQVRPLLPGSPSCAVLVTSRRELPGLTALHDAHHVALEPLGLPAAVELLRTVIGADIGPAAAHAGAAAAHSGPGAAHTGPGSTHTGPTVADLTDLAERCARLPLALRIAAAKVRHDPRRDLAGYLGGLRAAGALDALQLDSDPRAAVRSAFDLSYAALPATTRRLFRLAGVAPGDDLSVPAAAALLDADPATAAEQLDHLVGLHLMSRDGGRYHMHDLLRTYAVERCAEQDGAPATDAALGRLLGFLLATVAAAAEVGTELPAKVPADLPTGTALAFDDATAALAWLDHERRNLVAATRYAAGHAVHRPWAWHCALHLTRYFWMRRHRDDWLAIGEAGLAAATAAGDARAVARMHNVLGVAGWALADYPRAIRHITGALDANVALGAVAGQAANLSNLGGVYRLVGRYHEAAEVCRRAVALFRELGDERSAANTLLTLGGIAHDTGSLLESVPVLEETLEIYRRLELSDAVGAALVHLSAVRLKLGDARQAAAHAEEAAAALAGTGSRAGEAAALEQRANAYLELGRLDEARAQADRAAPLLDEVDDAESRAALYRAVGAVRLRQRDDRAALEHFERARALAQDAGARHGTVEAAVGAALARHRLLGTDVLAELDEVRALAARWRLPLWEGTVLTVAAETALELGSAGHARRLAQQALPLHEHAGQVRWRRRTVAVLERTAGD